MTAVHLTTHMSMVMPVGNLADKVLWTVEVTPACS